MTGEDAAAVAAAAAPVIRRALEEDLGARGDLTTLAVVPATRQARARLVAREAGVLAGIEVAGAVFREVDPAIRFEALLADGARLQPGVVAAALAGPARGILSAERVALNLLQRLCGVATLTARFVEAVAGTGVVIRDTRKTTPGLRALEKYAVRVGGGANHRVGLFDMILVKDNHVAAAGGMVPALRNLRAGRPAGIPVEVEVRTLDETRAVLAAGVDRILLDNMSPEAAAAAVALVRAQAHPPRVEVSGGITLESVRRYALPGVDDISVGALTHSARAIDLALDFEPEVS